MVIFQLILHIKQEMKISFVNYHVSIYFFNHWKILPFLFIILSFYYKLDDLDTNLICRVWDSIKINNLTIVKELNVRYRERVAAAEAEQANQTKQFQREVGKRGFRAKNLFEGLPYHKIINMAILWAAARFHLEIVDYLLDEKAINFK